LGFYDLPLGNELLVGPQMAHLMGRVRIKSDILTYDFS
jgi:hypothetical protein